MAKYVPPHARAATPPMAEPASPAGGNSVSDWLREARQGYVPKTPEQVRAECLSMNFEQLRLRAGPPPTVRAEQFVWATEGCRPDEINDPENTMFDSRMGAFKKGQGAPPAPLPHNQRDDDGHANAPIKAYRAWYSQWGERLYYLWRTEHPVAPIKKKLLPTRRPEEEKAPSRGALAAAADVGEKSGW